MTQEITMPNEWDPREYQKPLWRYLSDEKNKRRRAVCVWHRRAGKDALVLNLAATLCQGKIGAYWHMLPTQKQARKVIWDGFNKEGKRHINQAFPHILRENTRSHEMQIVLKSGSIWQLCGSDNYDSLMGAGPVGVVFSEWSLCDPAAWDYISPMLEENGGWALFIYTPRHKNHGHTLWEMARKNSNWFSSLLTIDDTKRQDGSRIITTEQIQLLTEEGMSEAKLQQEYYCSFEATLPGAYFALEVAAMRKDNRICPIPIETTLPVYTFWDLGISKGGSMIIWFVQAIGKEIRLVDYYDDVEGRGMPHAINYVDNFAKTHNITYAQHFAPHDINVHDLMKDKKTRLQIAREMGIKFHMVEKCKSIADGNEKIRLLFPRLWMDINRCANGISALASYRRKWNAALAKYDDVEIHDWASNGAAALRQLVQVWKDNFARPGITHMETFIANTGYDPLA